MQSPARERGLCVCVMSDGYYGSIRGRAAASGLDLTAVTLPPRQLGAVVRALGLETVEVGSVDDFRAALQSFSSSLSPAVIDCRFEADSYARLASALR